MIFGNHRSVFSRRTRHKVFISHYHRDDQVYRDQFEARYGHLFISESVRPGDIDSDLSAEYIKRLIREDYITESSVIAVLVGPNTKLRKHVDWEISAGLSKIAGGYSGLAAFLLPTFPLYSNPLTGRLEYCLVTFPIGSPIMSVQAMPRYMPGPGALPQMMTSALPWKQPS